MQTKTYLVTNNSEGSICVTGRARIDIPGMCKDLPLVLPENTARATVSRLKQRYPLLKIRESQESQATNGNTPLAPAKSDNNADNGGNAPTENTGDTNNKNGAPATPETADDKNGAQNNSEPNQAQTQKPDNKKGK